MGKFIKLNFKLSTLVILILINLLNCKKENNKNEFLKNILLVTAFSYYSDSPFSVYAIKDLNLNSFIGKWNEYKRIDNSFQAGLKNVTAEYSILEPNKVSVKNTGYTEFGAPSIIEGIGIIKYPDTKGYLKVSFSPLFYADYYVIKVDSNYNYALIGGPVPEILWILTKQDTVPSSTEIEFTNYAKSIGYSSDLLKSFK